MCYKLAFIYIFHNNKFLIYCLVRLKIIWYLFSWVMKFLQQIRYLNASSLMQIIYFSNLFILAQIANQELGAKVGKCPTLTPEQEEEECPPSESVNSTCLLDRDCPGDLKCCQGPCAPACIAPVELVKPEERKGPKGPPGDKGDPVSSENVVHLWAIIACD